MKRKALSDPVCHLCRTCTEDTMHALCGCVAAKQVWSKEFNCVNQFEASQGSFLDLVARVMSKPRVPEKFVTAAWFIWSHRNKTRLQENSLPLSRIGDEACKFLQLFQASRDKPRTIKHLRSCRCHQNQGSTNSTSMARCSLKERMMVSALW